jgi:glycosyltransferase involved in cell wall biosynthesis
MPSVYKSETLGVAAIEASAMGIPVIASNIGGIPEVVEHNVTGILTEPGDSGAIADALMLLMRNEGLRSAMGRAARKKAEELFSFSSCVANMTNCYASLIEKKTAQGDPAAVSIFPRS